MSIDLNEILETIKMIDGQSLDIRTVTLGLNLKDCCDSDVNNVAKNIKSKIISRAKDLRKTVESISLKYGIPVANKRISTTPIATITEGCNIRKPEDFLIIAKALDEAAIECNVDFIGGYSAIVDKNATENELALIKSLPLVLSQTQRLCSSVNVASTKGGINMDVIALLGEVIKETSYNTRDIGSIGCAKFVAFANAVSDNPFMAGSFFGESEGESGISVGISGPGVVSALLKNMQGADFTSLANEIKKISFKITRAGELIGQEVANAMNIPFNIVDLSLAPTTAQGDSVAEILELMGLERAGTHGTTAALYILTDAVKKGGIMASSRVGGLSGAFIPVSEDEKMITAVKDNAMTIDKLEALTAICSVGLDMVFVAGDTTAATLSAIIADECAIGVINKKTTAVRIIPVYGKAVGDYIDYGGLLGYGYIAKLHTNSSEEFISRGGRIPAPIQSYNN